MYRQHMAHVSYIYRVLLCSVIIMGTSYATDYLNSTSYQTEAAQLADNFENNQVQTDGEKAVTIYFISQILHNNINKTLFPLALTGRRALTILAALTNRQALAELNASVQPSTKVMEILKTIVLHDKITKDKAQTERFNAYFAIAQDYCITTLTKEPTLIADYITLAERAVACYKLFSAANLKDSILPDPANILTILINSIDREIKLDSNPQQYLPNLQALQVHSTLLLNSKKSAAAGAGITQTLENLITQLSVAPVPQPVPQIPVPQFNAQEAQTQVARLTNNLEKLETTHSAPTIAPQSIQAQTSAPPTAQQPTQALPAQQPAQAQPTTTQIPPVQQPAQTPPVQQPAQTQPGVRIPDRSTVILSHPIKPAGPKRTQKPSDQFMRNMRTKGQVQPTTY